MITAWTCEKRIKKREIDTLPDTPHEFLVGNLKNKLLVLLFGGVVVCVVISVIQTH